ncbi:MAG: hypothetical protein GY937_03845 [bacterium]|nr:hypothetical protein [bacterium]
MRIEIARSGLGRALLQGATAVLVLAVLCHPATAQEDEPSIGQIIEAKLSGPHHSPLDFQDRINEEHRESPPPPGIDVAGELAAYEAELAARNHEAANTQRALWNAASDANRNNDPFRHAHAESQWDSYGLRRRSELNAEARAIEASIAREEARLEKLDASLAGLERRWDDLTLSSKLVRESGEKVIRKAAEISDQRSRSRARLRILHGKQQRRSDHWREFVLGEPDFPGFMPTSPSGPVYRTIGPSPALRAPTDLRHGMAQPGYGGDPCAGLGRMREAMMCQASGIATRGLGWGALQALPEERHDDPPSRHQAPPPTTNPCGITLQIPGG